VTSEIAKQSSQTRGWAWFPDRGVARTLLELLIVVPAYILYQLVRGTVDGRAGDAFATAGRIVDFERAIGIYWEAELQSLILTWDIAARLANTVYVWGHLPVIVGLAIWLFAFHRHRYAMFRNAFLISGGIALFFFWLFPTAPPRYLQYWGFVDTAVHSTSHGIFQSEAFVNQYAAMPSLHFAWSLLGSIAIYLNVRSSYRYLAFVMPIITLGGIVLTANHFFVDAAAGGAVALLALWLAVQLRAHVPQYKPFTVLT
jgi:hypothetical protein